MHALLSQRLVKEWSTDNQEAFVTSAHNFCLVSRNKRYRFKGEVLDTYDELERMQNLLMAGRQQCRCFPSRFSPVLQAWKEQQRPSMELEVRFLFGLLLQLGFFAVVLLVFVWARPADSGRSPADSPVAKTGLNEKDLGRPPHSPVKLSRG